jgi:molecular chaperone GrpE (heat shock protein)
MIGRAPRTLEMQTAYKAFTDAVKSGDAEAAKATEKDWKDATKQFQQGWDEAKRKAQQDMQDIKSTATQSRAKYPAS